MPGGISAKDVIAEAKRRRANHIFLHYSPSSFYFESISQAVLLAKDSDIDVLLIEAVPVWDVHIPKTMYKQISDPSIRILQSRDEYLSKNEIFYKEFNQINSENYFQIPVVDYFCNPFCLYSSDTDVPYYFDSGHLTLRGGDILEDLLAELMLEVTPNL